MGFFNTQFVKYWPRELQHLHANLNSHMVFPVHFFAVFTGFMIDAIK